MFIGVEEGVGNAFPDISPQFFPSEWITEGKVKGDVNVNPY